MDWSKCFLCQEENTENFNDPVPTLYKGHSPGSGYATLAGNIFQFRTINSISMKLNSSLFEDDAKSLKTSYVVMLQNGTNLAI